MKSLLSVKKYFYALFLIFSLVTFIARANANDYDDTQLSVRLLLSTEVSEIAGISWAKHYRNYNSFSRPVYAADYLGFVESLDADMSKLKLSFEDNLSKHEDLSQAQIDDISTEIENLHLMFVDFYKRTYIQLQLMVCLLYTSPSPRDRTRSRMPSSA